jgi:sec-independent protein translocase protein TatA
MPRIGPIEIIIILVIILIIFGVGRLPEVGAGLGKGIRNFKKSMAGQDETKDEEKPAAKAIDKPADKKGEA